MVEVRDTNSGAILFKKTKSEKKVEELEDRVKLLETMIEGHVINKDKLSSVPNNVSI